MKETCNSVVSTADPGRKRKKRKRGTSFSNSKQKRWRELRNKEQTYIQGNEPPIDLNSTVTEVKIGGSSRHNKQERIEEEREQRESCEPSMAESEHQSNSNKSGSEEESKKDSISIVSLGWGLYAEGAGKHLGL